MSYQCPVRFRQVLVRSQHGGRIKRWMMQVREVTLLCQIPMIIVMEENNNLHRTRRFIRKWPVGNSASTHFLALRCNFGFHKILLSNNSLLLLRCHAFGACGEKEINCCT